MQKKFKTLAVLTIGLILTAVTLTSCLKEGTDTIVLPLPDGKIPTSVIPQNLQDSLVVNGFDINEGVEPPMIEGRFVSAPMILHYASDDYVNNFYDLYMTFAEQQPRGMVKYTESQDNTVTGNSIEADVIGTGNKFTMYCYQNVTDSLNGQQLYRCKTATVVSGWMDSTGIKNCKYSIIVLEKEAINNYYDSRLPAVGTFRVFFDGDNLAVRL